MGEPTKRLSAKRLLLDRQRAWASDEKLPLDERGYARAYGPNLFRPLSPRTLRCFEHGSGNELRDSHTRPAKMRATHSSSALAANVFDYWIETPSKALQLLDLPGQALSLGFEEQFPTGLPGEPPNLDLCIERASGPRIAVESKFTEWLTPHPKHARPFKGKYFQDERRAWEVARLPSSQRLAEQMHAGLQEFRYLNAAQLLKHALGLACADEPFELVYLYFDAPGPEAQQHAAELAVFASHAQADFPFHVRTYQEMFDRICALAGPADAKYVTYIKARYMR